MQQIKKYTSAIVIISKLFSFIIMLTLTTACNNEKKDNLNDLQIFIKKLQTRSTQDQDKTANFILQQFQQNNTPIVMKDIFTNNSKSSSAKNYNLTGIIQIDQKYFGLLQNGDTSTIVSTNDQIMNGKIAEIDQNGLRVIQQQKALTYSLKLQL